MHGLNLAYQVSSPFTLPCTHLERIERRDERSDSHSDSEDSHNPHLQKLDMEPEDDPNVALTSQTLNADGTPKRPMNAFMIFARRRRPQVSAENQSMRTGEISKILSKEWNSMEMAEKQFYLDQAKQLKDTFNSKYPDYVYRRRPNNSRKKRRTEGGVIRTVDNLLLHDHGDDISGSDTYGEHSPVEPDDGFGETLSDSHLSHVSTAFGENNCVASQLRNHSYIYPAATDIPRRVQAQETRMSHLAAQAQRASVASTTRLQESQHSHVHAQHLAHQTQTSTPFSAEPTTANANWDTRGGSSNFATSNWSSSQRRLAVSSTPKQPAFTAANPPQQQQPSAWPDPSVAAPMGPNNTGGSQAASYAFPTLNSPFYPQTNQLDGNYQTTGSSLVAQAGPTVHYDASHGQVHSATSIEHTSRYDERTYPSPPVARYATTFAQDLDRESHLYQQQPQPRTALPRPLQSVTPFAPSHSHPISSSSHMHFNPTTSSQLAYWSRDKLE